MEAIEIQKQPFIVLMLALDGWTEEQLKTQPEHIITAGAIALSLKGEELLNGAKAEDFVRAAAVAYAVCGDADPNYKPPKRSKFEERLEEMQRRREEDKARKGKNV